LEVLLGITVFSLFMLAVGLVLIAGQENTIVGADRMRASYLGQMGLDAARSIRDASYSSLATGTHGFSQSPTGKWQFSGTQSVMTGGYIASVSVSSAGTGIFLASQVRWKHGYNRSGSLVLRTELTNWRTVGQVGDWSNPSLESTYTESGAPDFNDVKVVGNYALVSGAGNGIYIYDVTNTAATPTRVNSSFNMGYTAYQMAVYGRMLYVVTSDSNAELKAYTLTALPSLTLRASYNLQGSGRGRAIRANGPLLYIGTQQSGVAGENEFITFDITQSGSIVAKASLDDATTNLDIAFTGTAAYLAASDDAGELRVVNISSSGSLSLVGGAGYNLSSTEDALSVATSGTAALVGRERGTGTEELVLLRLPAGGGRPKAVGPWYREMSGSVVGLAIDGAQCYGFAAVRQGWKALQIVRLRDTSLSELYSYTLSSDGGKKLFYDHVRDRLFFLTDTSLMIFKPSASTGSC
jgi:hypothetical protein